MQSSIMQPRCCGGGAMLAPHVRWSFLQPQISSTFTTPARHIFCHQICGQQSFTSSRTTSFASTFQTTNSPPHLFTSRRFSLKLNQHFPWFRGGPQPAYSHAPVPTYHGRHHPPQICHATAQTLRSSFQARTRLINPVTHPHAATFSAIRAMRSTYRAAGYVDSQL